MSEKLCKFQVFDRKKSPSWGPKVYRNCQRKVAKDGFCMLHHPDEITLRLEEWSMFDVMRDIREQKEIEEKIVGIYLRLMQPEKFSSLLVEANEAQERIEEAYSSSRRLRST